NQILTDFNLLIGKDIDGNKVTEESLIKEKSLEYITIQQEQILLRDKQKEILSKHPNLTKHEKRELLIKERLINPLTKEEKEKLDSYFDVEPPLSRQKIMLVQELADEIVPIMVSAQNLYTMRDMSLRLVNASKMASLGHLTGGVMHNIDNPLGSLIMKLGQHKADIEDAEKYVECMHALSKKYDSFKQKITEQGNSQVKELVFEFLSGFEELKNEFEKKEQKREEREKRRAKRRNEAYIKKGKSLLSQGLERYFQGSEKQLNAISSVVKKLRKFTRTDQTRNVYSNDIKQEMEDNININDIARQAISHYHINSKDITIEAKLNPEIPLIRCHPSSLNDVFTTILNNSEYAIVEKQEKQGRYKGKIKIETNIVDDGIQIRFYDNGIGIKEENIHKVFDPFFSAKPEGKGSGLGLSIAQSIIKEHNGYIAVKSEYLKETVFRIILPVNGKKKKF
ncbi:MAG: hypothetical protein DRJ64_10790, partial [Thermoprotei archaeon]